eukprot:scaffold108068_cov63-Phaeocystis_antarctica.AAC.8
MGAAVGRALERADRVSEALEPLRGGKGQRRLHPRLLGRSEIVQRLLEVLQRLDRLANLVRRRLATAGAAHAEGHITRASPKPGGRAARRVEATEIRLKLRGHLYGAALPAGL